MTASTPLFAKLKRILRHRWTDDADVHRALPPQLLVRLQQRVAASEQRHTGEVRICVEAALPMRYLLRGATARERAVMVFSKLRVWDTEHNNGVLVYLLLADRAIEIVADRAIHAKVGNAQWKTIAQRMSTAFKAANYEDGLTDALAEVSALLVQWFPAQAGKTDINELPDAPVVL